METDVRVVVGAPLSEIILKRYRITFTRRVKEYCVGDFLAQDIESARKMYDDGEIATNVFESDILDETDVEIVEL